MTRSAGRGNRRIDAGSDCRTSGCRTSGCRLIKPGKGEQVSYVGAALIAFGTFLIAYVYALYPAVLRLLQRRPFSGPILPAASSVSIIIAARNAGRSVADKVVQL